MTKNFTLATLLLVAASSADAFVVPPSSMAGPAAVHSAEQSTTSLGMKFMKDLGFEKPSWLPNFGGADKEEKVEEVVASADDEEGDEVEAEEGAEAVAVGEE